MCPAFKPEKQFQKGMIGRGLARLVWTKNHRHIGDAFDRPWKYNLGVFETAIADQV